MYLTFDREESQLKDKYWAVLPNEISSCLMFLIPTESQFARCSSFAVAQLHLIIVLHKEECGSKTMDMNWAVAVHFFWDTGAFSWSQFSVIFLRNLLGHGKSGEGHELSSKWWSKVAAGGDCWLIIDTSNRNCRKMGLNIKCILLNYGVFHQWLTRPGLCHRLVFD